MVARVESHSWARAYSVQDIASVLDEDHQGADELKMGHIAKCGFHTSVPGARAILPLADPLDHNAAMKRPDHAKWTEAVNKQFKSLRENETWKYVPAPTLQSGKKVIGCKWVFKIKYAADGAVDKYKARLVAKGFAQEHGRDYWDTFAPVLHYKTLRVLLAIVASLDYELKQMDVPTAFLNAKIDEDVYMRPPQGLEGVPAGHVCKLLKTLYGVKQAPRMWNIELSNFVINLGYMRCESDPCIYVKRSSTGRMIIVPVFVDDIFPACHKEDLAEMYRDMDKLMVRYKIETLDDANVVLGMRITRNRAQRTLKLDQEQYILRMIDTFKMNNCTTVMSPSLRKDSELVTSATDNEYLGTQGEEVDPNTVDERSVIGSIENYGTLVGGLQYAALSTRPDIAHAASFLSQNLAKPATVHWVAAKRVLQYLKGTSSRGLTYGGGTEDVHLGPAYCEAEWKPKSVKPVLGPAYCDASWGSKVDGRSTSGYIVKINDGPVSWSSKKQPTQALSTAEAEYMAVGAVTQEVIWMRNLLDEMGFPQKNATVVHCDNEPAIRIASDDVHHARTKHINIRHHFVRDHISDGVVALKWVRSALQQADILTKALGPKQFAKNARDLLGDQ